MKYELKGRKLVIVLGIITILVILGFGVVISLIGSNIFPDWWNKPLGT